MTVYRLSRARYKQDLTGKGAEIAGGRWNSKGVPMLYTAASVSLCTVEVAVHLPLGLLPPDYNLIEIEVSAGALTTQIDAAKLPSDWRSLPHTNATQNLGDNFVREGRYMVMKVPSAVVAGEFNYLLNPLHKDFSKVKVVSTRPYHFDSRLFIR